MTQEVSQVLSWGSYCQKLIRVGFQRPISPVHARTRVPKVLTYVHALARTVKPFLSVLNHGCTREYVYLVATAAAEGGKKILNQINSASA